VETAGLFYSLENKLIKQVEGAKKERVVLPKNHFGCRKTFWINLSLASGDYKTRLRLKQV
jgi:hypothetical protein